MARRGQTAAPTDEPVESESAAVENETVESVAEESDDIANPAVAAEAEADAPVAEPAADPWFKSVYADAADESDALARIQRERQEAAQWQQYANYYAAQAAQAAQAQRQQQQPVPQAAEQKPWHHKHWNPPEFKKEWLTQWVERDADGNVGLRADTPPDVRQKLADYQAYKQSFRDNFEQNPVEWMYNALREKLVEDVRSGSQETLGSYQEQQQATQLFQQIAPWACVQGQGGPVFNQLPDGRQVPVLTEEGQRYANYLASFSMLPQEQAHARAIDLMERDYYRQQALGGQRPVQQQPAQTVDERNAALKKQFVQGAKRNGHTPNRSGTVATARQQRSIPQNARLDWEETARGVAEEMGFPLNN